MEPMVFQAIVSLLCLCTSLGEASSTFELAPEDYLRWNYTYFNENCTYVTGDRNPCQDIRICNFAVASQALGGWPTLCGWVHIKVPKVCCGLPLVLGPKLMKKTDEEKARKRECGTKLYSTRLSQTENRFFEILHGLPPVDTSNPDKFDPPLDLAEETIVSPTGGVPSRQGEFPWMVSIHKAGRHWCGGSIIDRIHVLSAAHCFVSERAKIPDPNMYTVYVGNIHLDKGFPFRVQNISIHEKYIIRLHYHDIALLTLNEEILSPVFAHICLPPPEIAAMDLSGRNTTVLGWGHTEFGADKGISLNDFLDRIDLIATHVGWSDEDKLTVIRVKVAGEAAELIRNNPRLKKEASLDYVVKALKERFSSVHQFALYIRALIQAFQKPTSQCDNLQHYGALLGTKFLADHNMHLDFSTSQLLGSNLILKWNPSQPSAMNNKIFSTSVSQSFRYSVTKHKLPPFSENIIKLTARSENFTTDTVLIEPLIEHAQSQFSIARQKPYKVPYHLRDELDRQVAELLEANIIQESDSPYSAPVLFVKKADNTYRLVTDFRKLNEKTIEDSFPLPSMIELIE
ncbi:clotting factor B-like, partial [Stegodyphus dumicola]|uniref:clotting factor B-like n=1 Tax=Stegodyphus dumicola TaxID=202533 RepID=UPI0015B31AEE